ncbi:RagB/SusD family nutrient uptake outer membrane protein [Pseudoflavitalea sp. X16]|uniref:RagB/SusD family nutrient uptake outer membrane protein n=1 Tax=Paraflavitalea devenefica TaxID=2716334 RepID=UPI00141DEAC2|nr:RagB/SusD family nutrient uptake outer membrane protein [Paraflavitalea devenefica]NII26623.1 RagB/SusD family nutrient uptake outer membrane protein [Paraflavitalea devenefica]
MKKQLFYTTLLMVLALGGCKKFANEEPLSDGKLEDFFKSVYEADAAMAGMYAGMQQCMIGESQFNNRLTYWGDARADNMEPSQYANNNHNEMFLNSLTPNNTYSDWGPLYTIIGRANLNIAKFPEINNYARGSQIISDATLKSYLMQCYTMRAVCYFYLLRIWGGVPIRTTPFLKLDDNPKAPRESKAKVKEQIISDLQTAYDLIATKGSTPIIWYLHEGAIAAIMADVYMWRSHDDEIMPEYDKAIEWMKILFKSKGATGKVYNATGQTVTGSGGVATDLETTGNWKGIFTNPAGSIETIWSLHWNVDANGCPCMAGVSSARNNTPIKTAFQIFNTWGKSTTDTRGKQTIDQFKTDNWDRVIKWYGPNGFTNATTTYLTSAQAASFSGTDKTVYVPMYRLADMFLLYAEALNKTGDRDNARRYLNLVRMRATLPAYTTAELTTETEMEDAILNERRWELFAEGKRWFDLVRTDRVIQIMDPILKARQLANGGAEVGFGTDKRKYMWPLNRNVMNANPNLQQNKPYSD